MSTVTQPTDPNSGTKFIYTASCTPPSQSIPVFTITRPDVLEKVIKQTTRVFDAFLAITGSLSQSSLLLLENLRNSIVVFDSIKIFGATKMLVCADTKGKYLLTNPENTWQKKADRICLFFHCCFKTYKGIVKVGLAKYGALAKNAVGKLPVFHLAMDSFILAQGFFGGWDSALKLPKMNKKLKCAETQITKWEARPFDIYLLKQSQDPQTFSRYAARYTQKNVSISTKLAEKEALIQTAPKNKIKAIQSEIAELNTKKIKNEIKLEFIQKNNYEGLVNHLTKAPIETKVKKWEYEKQNAKIQLNGNWLGIAGTIGKIAVVTLALTLTALNSFTLPYTLSLLTLGFVVDSIGLAKIFYGEYERPVKITKTPEPIFV